MNSAEFLVQCVRFRFRTASRFVRLALSTHRHSAACKVTQVERNTCVLQHHISCSSLQRVHLSASELRGSAVFDQTRRCAASTKLLISSLRWCESCRSKFAFQFYVYILSHIFSEYIVHFSSNIKHIFSEYLTEIFLRDIYINDLIKAVSSVKI